MTLPRQAPPLPEPVAESTWTRPRPDCPDPGRWHSTDSDSTELEVSALVAAFTVALQPDLVVETGTAWGQTAEMIGQCLQMNGQGRLVTFETDGERAAASRTRCDGLPVQILEETSQDGIAALGDGTVGFAWLDSLLDLRAVELEQIRPKLTPHAVVGVHDTGPHRRRVRRSLPTRGWRRIDLPTPRGVSFLQPC